MDELTERISELERISSALEPIESERNEYQRLSQDFANSFIERLDETKSYSDAKVRKESLSLKGGRKSLKELIEIYSTEVANTGIKASSGRRFIYIGNCRLFSGYYQ